MSRKFRRYDANDIPKFIREYADTRTLELHQYTEFHYRLIDDQFTVLDFWPTSGKYYVKETNYFEVKPGIPERAGETGFLPFGKAKIFTFLDKLFYAADRVTTQ